MEAGRSQLSNMSGLMSSQDTSTSPVRVMMSMPGTCGKARQLFLTKQINWTQALLEGMVHHTSAHVQQSVTTSSF